MMSPWKDQMRSWLKPASRRSRTTPRLTLEALETRETPSITTDDTLVSGGPQPTFQPVGPVAIQDASNVILGSPELNIQIGAVESITVDPFNPNRVAVGSVNGGVWVTNDISAPTPVWTTTTDALPSLAISSVAWSPSVPNLLFAGTGSYTAGGIAALGFFAGDTTNQGIGGTPGFVYRSADGGQTWAQVGGNTFARMRVRNILPTTLNGGQTVFAAMTEDRAGGPSFGIWRSNDLGNTWVRQDDTTGLPTLGATSLIADPANPNRFYAAFVGGVGAGVYMLDATGGNTNWVNITTEPLTTAAADSPRILLAASPAGAQPVYAAVIDPNGNPRAIYRGVSFSGTYIWTAVGPNGLPPDVNRGQQATVHFAIVADPTSDRYVYVAGDRRDPFPYGGNMARGDFFAGTWTTVTAPTIGPATPGTTTPLSTAPTPTTSPHPDLRWLAFTNSNTILAGTDGGIYRLTNPRAENGLPPTWSSVNGNLGVTEGYSAVYDNRNTPDIADDVVMVAAQDNGSNEAVLGGTWREVNTGDGILVLADPVGNYRYSTAQNFFMFRRNPDGTLVSPPGTVANSGGRILNPAAPGTLIENLPFQTAAVLSQTSPNRMLVGGFQTLYLSEDRGDTFVSIGGVTNNAPDPVTNINGTVVAISFGTAQVPFAAYVISDDGTIARSFDITSGGGGFVLTDFTTVSGGEQPIAVVMDPNNPLVAYAITNNRVFKTVNGLNWTNITGNLLGLITQGGRVNFASLDLVNRGTANTADDVLLVGANGGVFSLQVAQTTPSWLRVGVGLPNVLVTTVQYDELTDSLLVGTYGRGAWVARDVSAALTVGKTVIVTGNGGANEMWITGDPTNPAMYTVADGLGNVQTFNSAEYLGVIFRGLGGADTIRVGSTPAGVPAVTWPLQVIITADGGGNAGDRLIFDAAADTVGRQTTVTPTTIDAAKTDTAFSGFGRITYTGFDAGSIQVRMGAGDDLLIFDDSASAAPTGYTLNSTRLVRSLGGVYDYAGADRMVVRGSQGNNSYQIDATGASTTVEDGSGTSVINVQGDALQGAFSVFRGGAGNDLIRLNAGTGFTTQVHASGNGVEVVGRTVTDAVTVAVNDSAGGGSLTGLGFPVTFDRTLGVAYRGNGGSDTLDWIDNTDGGYGVPADPAGGVVVYANGPSGGRLLVARGAVLPGLTFSGVSNFGVNGDGNGSGDVDVLAVVATSTTGAQSAFGEATADDGRDTVFVSDTSITIRNNTNGGPSLNVTPIYNGGATTFSTIYVATGNETGSSGDVVTAVPSLRVNLLVDGMRPTRSPGDSITIQAPGPFDVVDVTDPALGPPHTRHTQVGDGASIGIIGFENVTSPGATTTSGIVVVGSDAGVPARVRAFDRLTGALRFEFFPFGDFTGGVSVAAGDLNGDGTADIVVGAGPGGGPRIAVFNGRDGSYLYDFFGYEDTFRGGVNVAVADMNGDGASDIILGTGPGGGPRVRILDGLTLNPILDTFAYDINFRGGVTVATGDFNNDGIPDLITSTGASGGPHVIVRDGSNFNSLLASFFVFDPNDRNGFYVTSADVTGDGVDDIIAGSGPNTPARVRVFSGVGGQLVADFFINDPFNPTEVPFILQDVGVRVAAADIDGDGISDIVTTKGPGSQPILRAYGLGAVNPLTNALSVSLREVRNQFVFEPDFGFGVFVGASN